MVITKTGERVIKQRAGGFQIEAFATWNKNTSQGCISAKALGEFLAQKVGHVCTNIEKSPFTSDFIFTTEVPKKKRK